ncbi:hypothetical protein EDC04DRAFT_2605307 [Pisolithus marmoratus]|nr:hypothetical protein EDC04DRAFT_2605307 [Pisolithus marmoratus]
MGIAFMDPYNSHGEDSTCLAQIAQADITFDTPDLDSSNFRGDLSQPEGAAILLISNAAHIHSPPSGQGMNLSLRDAIFLGEVFMKHIKATESMPLPEADCILSKFVAE